jgi:hypothetical protein
MNMSSRLSQFRATYALRFLTSLISWAAVRYPDVGFRQTEADDAQCTMHNVNLYGSWVDARQYHPAFIPYETRCIKTRFISTRIR